MNIKLVCWKKNLGKYLAYEKCFINVRYYNYFLFMPQMYSTETNWL